MRALRSPIATNSIIVASGFGALTTFCLTYLAGFLSEDLFARLVVISPILCGLLGGMALSQNGRSSLKRAVTAGLIAYIELHFFLVFCVFRFGLRWTQPVLGFALHVSFYPPFALYGPAAAMIGGMFGWLIASALVDEDFD